MDTPAPPDPQGQAQCKAKAKGTGEQCKRRPSPGLDVCVKHGAGSPRSREASARKVAEARAEQAVRTYGLPLNVSPTDALLQEVQWTAGHVAWLRARVQEIEQDALVWGITKRDNKSATEFEGVDETEEAKPNIWLELYARERKHLVDVCKAALAAGVEERRVKLAEQQGSLLAGVIKGILGDLGLSPEQQALVVEVVPRHLRAVS